MIDMETNYYEKIIKKHQWITQERKVKLRFLSSEKSRVEVITSSLIPVDCFPTDLLYVEL